MSKRTVWYRCISHCESTPFAFEPDSNEMDRWMAQEAADDYHSNHDGWEATWPLTFSLHETEDGPEVARFEVERECQAVFWAAAIKPVREVKP